MTRNQQDPGGNNAPRFNPEKYREELQKKRSVEELTSCLAENTGLAEEGFQKIRKISRGLRETSDKCDQIYQELLSRFENSKAKAEVRKIQEKLLNGGSEGKGDPKAGSGVGGAGSPASTDSEGKPKPSLEDYARVSKSKRDKELARSKEALEADRKAASAAVEAKPVQIAQADAPSSKGKNKKPEPLPDISKAGTDKTKLPTAPVVGVVKKDGSIEKFPVGAKDGVSALDRAIEQAKLRRIEEKQELEKKAFLLKQGRIKQAKAREQTDQEAKDFVASVKKGLEDAGKEDELDGLWENESVLQFILRDSPEAEDFK